MVHWLVRAHGYRWSEAFGVWPGGLVRCTIGALSPLGDDRGWLAHQGCTELLARLGIRMTAKRRWTPSWEPARSGSARCSLPSQWLTAPITEASPVSRHSLADSPDRGWRWVGCLAVSALFADPRQPGRVRAVAVARPVLDLALRANRRPDCARFSATPSSMA